jgi:putative tryptophan/tyrosine transport system substrate-binding protein
MRRREFIGLLGGAAAWPHAARAQRAGKIFTIGILNPVPPLPWQAALLDALRELGWIEGKNFVLERRHGNNQLERLHEAAAELARLNVDLIVASGTLAPLAAKRATTTIPIVMAAAGDPLGSGLVASLARPGGNVTGLSLMAPDLAGKGLELLKEVVPRLSRVAVLWNSANPYPARMFKETQEAGQTLGIQVQSVEVRVPEDFAIALAAARSQGPDALIVVGDPLTASQRTLIAEFAAGQRLPALMERENLRRSAGLCLTGQALPTCIGAPPATSTRYSRAPRQPTFLCSNRPSLS